MALQEREKAEVVLTPAAEKARIIDLVNKVECWKGHIEIAQKNGGLRQVRVGEVRLRAVRQRMSR